MKFAHPEDVLDLPNDRHAARLDAVRAVYSRDVIRLECVDIDFVLALPHGGEVDAIGLDLHTAGATR